MIRPDVYPNSLSPDASHQFGSYKDETSVGANDGTGLFKDQMMDAIQWIFNLMTKFSITPSAAKEDATTSQAVNVLDKEINLYAGNVATISASGSYELAAQNKNGVLILDTAAAAVTILAGAGIDDGSRLTILNTTGSPATINPGAITLLDNERVVLFYNSHSGAFDSLLGKQVFFGTLHNQLATDSTSPTTGSIRLDGGLGVAKNIHAGGTLKTDDVSDATNKDSGSIITQGGIGAEKSIVAGLNGIFADAIAAKIILRSDGKISTGGELAPDCDVGGITLYTTATGPTVVTFKNSNIAHGMTSLAETDTFAEFKMRSANDGGLAIDSFTESGIGLACRAKATTEDTTETVSSDANIILEAALKSGVGDQDHGADANLLIITNNGVNAQIFKGDGDIYTNTDQTSGLTGTFDKENDIALLKAISNSFQGITNNELLKKANELGIINKHGFRSHEKSWKLNMGALLQLWNIIRHSFEALGIDENKLIEYSKQY